MLKHAGMPGRIIGAYRDFMEGTDMYNAVAGGIGEAYRKKCRIPVRCAKSRAEGRAEGHRESKSARRKRLWERKREQEQKEYNHTGCHGSAERLTGTCSIHWRYI